MALDTTVGGTSAESYATVKEADEYATLQLGVPAWTALSPSEKENALRFATKMIDREVFWGSVDSPDQALKFPRNSTAEIPERVKQAQMEQSFDIARGAHRERQEFQEMQSRGVRQVGTAETMVRMHPGSAESFPSFSLCKTARELLMPFIEWGVRLGRA